MLKFRLEAVSPASCSRQRVGTYTGTITHPGGTRTTNAAALSLVGTSTLNTSLFNSITVVP